jgi:hypothetical protein
MSPLFFTGLISQNMTILFYGLHHLCYINISPGPKKGRIKMPVLLVTYDTNTLGHDYFGLYEALKKYERAQLFDSLYAVKTDKAPKELYNELRLHLGENDAIYIMTLSEPWEGRGPDRIYEWLEAHL